MTGCGLCFFLSDLTEQRRTKRKTEGNSVCSVGILVKEIGCTPVGLIEITDSEISWWGKYLSNAFNMKGFHQSLVHFVPLFCSWYGYGFKVYLTTGSTTTSNMWIHLLERPEKHIRLKCHTYIFFHSEPRFYKNYFWQALLKWSITS